MENKYLVKIANEKLEDPSYLRLAGRAALGAGVGLIVGHLGAPLIHAAVSPITHPVAKAVGTGVYRLGRKVISDDAAHRVGEGLAKGIYSAPSKAFKHGVPIAAAYGGYRKSEKNQLKEQRANKYLEKVSSKFEPDMARPSSPHVFSPNPKLKPSATTSAIKNIAGKARPLAGLGLLAGGGYVAHKAYKVLNPGPEQY